MPLSATEILACKGGPKACQEPFPPRRLFSEVEKGAVCALFDRAIAEGSEVVKYSGEQEQAYCEDFAQYLGGGFADGVNSGTNAVFVALGATDPPPMSEVIVPPVSDAGGVMPVSILGCVPIAADACSGSYNTCAQEIEKVISKRTHAIIVAHIGGLPVDMDPILQLARRRNVVVIEDCAQAFGARYKGRMCGTLGHMAAFSTMFGKHHSSGGQGGLVFTKDERLYWAARRFADRGKSIGLEKVTGNVRAALNCNMDELHAVIGRANLSKLPATVARRRALAQRMAAALRERSRAVQLVTARSDDEASYWFLLFHLNLDGIRVDKDEFVRALEAEGVPVGPGYGHFPMRMPWAVERCVVCGASESCERAGCPMKDHSIPELPNAHATDRCRFLIGFHEGWADRHADSAVEAILKVEKAYVVQ